MKQRELGNSGISIAPLVFGGNVFGWTADERTSFDLLDAFVANGYNCIDTADVYSAWVPGHKGGESETVLGKWLKQSGKRSQVVIATKVGKPMGPGKVGLSAKWIMQAVEDSLTRLQTDYIDLYQSHDDDPATPFEETAEAFSRLIQQGKVRAIGASNFNAARLGQALEVSAKLGLPTYQTLQPLYNLYDRVQYEAELEPLCVENGVGVICFFALGSGFLTGKYRSENDAAGRARKGMLQKYFNERGYRILAALDQVSRETNSTPARVSLAWLLARPSITAPIASATSVPQLNELMEATRLVLPSSAIALLNQASA